MLRILFIELLGGLGDTLIALPAIQALAASHPQAHFTVLTFEPGGDLLHRHPLIDRVLQIPKGTARPSVEQHLQAHSYDLIVTDVSYEGIADLVKQSGAARVVTNLWRNPPGDQLVCDRFLQILLAESLITPEAAAHYRLPQIHLSQAELAEAQAELGATYRPLICLYPDAGMAIKHWSTAHFVALGQALQDRYSASLIIPVGSDPNQVHAITDQLPGAQPWPRGSLRQLAALFAHADCVIAGDTGPARVAAAVGAPTITLFGPSWRDRYGQPTPHINLQGFPNCPERNIANFTEQTCWYSGQCPFEWNTCVDLITPEEVLAAVEKVRGEESGVRREEWKNSPFNSSSPSTSPTTNHPLLATPDPIAPSGIQKTPLTPHPLTPHPLPLSPHPSLLVMRLDNIGDVLMTSPALQAIKETYPQAKLTLMASPGGSLAAPLLPWVDEVLTWRVLWQDLGRLPFDPAREWELIRTLKERSFDAAIIFTSFKQSPHPAALICQMAGIPVRIGESKETDTALTHAIPPAPDDLHQVERNLRLIESIGIRVRNRHLKIGLPPSSLHSPVGHSRNTPHSSPSSPYLLLNPWTSCQSRTYPLEKFAIATRRLCQITGWPVVVTGTEKDQANAAPLLEVLGDWAINRMGQTTLTELAALIAHARLMLSNNTSTMHIADAVQTPSVILFAGTELERQWQPRQTRAVLLRRPTTCSPCYQFTCPYQQECLDIAPDEVVKAGLDLLEISADQLFSLKS